MIDSRQAGTEIADEFGSYAGRGVWCPNGLSAMEIMVGAGVLEREFGVVPYESRRMVRAILSAIKSAKETT